MTPNPPTPESPPELPDDATGAHAPDGAVATTDDDKQGGDDSSMPPFEPVSMGFKHIWYTVTVGRGKQSEELDLLRDVSGAFEPGTMTALMGSSGAGKTTLMDVLAGRKNTGVIRGIIYLNGIAIPQAGGTGTGSSSHTAPHTNHNEGDEDNGNKEIGEKLRRAMGYVEQFDSLSPRDTVKEAVEFSAAMRLAPRDGDSDAASTATRVAWVKYILNMLELTPIQHDMVGESGGNGLSFEQRKRVSIAVELAANPAILFLDEPTSGLDARAATVVIRCIQRVAASGRSIVCTIHQPSIRIFTAFDSLLLLRRGGQTVFYGELGKKGDSVTDGIQNTITNGGTGTGTGTGGAAGGTAGIPCPRLVRYFATVPGVVPLQVRENPASWMLTAIGAGTSNSSNSVTDFHHHYNMSPLCATNKVRVNVLCGVTDEDEAGNQDAPRGPPQVGKEHAHCALMPVFTCAVKHLPSKLMAGKLTGTKDASSSSSSGSGTVTTQQSGEKKKPVKSSKPYQVGVTTQFYMLTKRATLSYWRSPTYNFGRMMISLIVALLFASTYVDQSYTNDVETTSRSAVIYITLLFTGVIGMMSVQPVAFSERPAFYREKQSGMYSVFIYSFAYSIVEVKYCKFECVFSSLFRIMISICLKFVNCNWLTQLGHNVCAPLFLIYIFSSIANNSFFYYYITFFAAAAVILCYAFLVAPLPDHVGSHLYSPFLLHRWFL